MDHSCIIMVHKLQHFFLSMVSFQETIDLLHRRCPPFVVKDKHLPTNLDRPSAGTLWVTEAPTENVHPLDPPCLQH
ncbi:unnamed protein product [Merluccius merluccius]